MFPRALLLVGARARLAAMLRMSLKVNWAAAALLASALPASAQPDRDADVAGEIGAILTVADGEYAAAVAHGQVIDSLEYSETGMMLAQARKIASPLLAEPGHGPRLAAALDSAAARMNRVAEPASFTAAIDDVRQALFEGWGAAPLPLPAAAPSSSRGARLYAAQCAACHGATGAGDGPAATMDPPPTDFTDPAILMESSPSRWFQVVSFGIPGTAMKGWRDELSDQQRWDLVAYLHQLGFSDEQRSSGARLFSAAATGAAEEELTGVSGQAELSGKGIVARLRPVSGPGDELTPNDSSLALVAHARTLLERTASPATADAVVASVRETLDRALSLHEAGDRARARRAALDAYLTFEGIERELGARAPDLTRRVEVAFADYRAALDRPGEEATAARAALDDQLDAALLQLADQPTIWSDFLASLVIILREGVEAILIIGALLAFLSRSGNREHLTSVYWGTGVAIVASLLTAVAVEVLFEIAPASQEALEGVTMLLAVVVLFSVSYWLVSKIEHKRWEMYIRGKLKMALSRGSSFALASVAFLAVYREGFETVLFYKALFGATPTSGGVLAGLGLGLTALAILCLAIYRFGVRIPLRPFFAATSAVLYYMAFVFAGKGVRELQEAGLVGATPLPEVSRIDLLGIYPTVETLAVQGVLLAALLLALGWTFALRPALSRATAEESAVTS